MAKANTKDQAGYSYKTNESKSLPKYLIPLFGYDLKTESEKKDDKVFIEMCKTNFPTVQDASMFFADRGWEYLAEGELDTAIYRFNLSYLLNDKNAEAYWGLGVICFQKQDLELAGIILKKGLESDTTNASLIVDLATVELACYQKNNHPEDLALAYNHLGRALDIDPSNILGWQKRSESEFYLENYENAWECVHSARLLDVSNLDLIFIEKLSLKMKDPKDIFKF